MANTFRPPSRIEMAYRASIRKLIEGAIPSWAPEMSIDDWLQKLANLSHAADIAEMGAAIAARMVRWVSVDNARTWREASSRSQRSLMLYRLLQNEMSGATGARYREIVAQNAHYIRRIPFDVAETLTGEIARAQQGGARPAAMARMMQVRFPQLVSSKINLIARTETSKASTALTQARSEDLNLPAYIWMTSMDSRVRPSHRNMNGVIVFWNDAPSPEQLIGVKSTLGHYHSGNCPNCRCSQHVILSLDDVFDRGSTARVYWGGSIVRMGRKQFASVSGIESRVAA